MDEARSRASFVLLSYGEGGGGAADEVEEPTTPGGLVGWAELVVIPGGIEAVLIWDLTFLTYTDRETEERLRLKPWLKPYIETKP